MLLSNLNHLTWGHFNHQEIIDYGQKTKQKRKWKVYSCLSIFLFLLVNSYFSILLVVPIDHKQILAKEKSSRTAYLPVADITTKALFCINNTWTLNCHHFVILLSYFCDFAPITSLFIPTVDPFIEFKSPCITDISWPVNIYNAAYVTSLKRNSQISSAVIPLILSCFCLRRLRHWIYTHYFKCS